MHYLDNSEPKLSLMNLVFLITKDLTSMNISYLQPNPYLVKKITYISYIENNVSDEFSKCYVL